MKLTDLREVNENVNLDEYLELYKYVRDNMEHITNFYILQKSIKHFMKMKTL